VGGNLVNASPIGDLTVLLLALGARLGLRSAEGTREVPLDGFYQGYKRLDLAEGEVMVWIAFSLPAPGAVLSFEKVARRAHLDIASVNSAACLRVETLGAGGAGGGKIVEARLAAGGVAPIPFFLTRTSGYLVGKQGRAEVIREALGIAQEEIAPISDVRGTAAYKRLALRQLLIAHFLRAFPEELAGEDWR
jgi:xanthine dehydrogenase small subunit